MQFIFETLHNEIKYVLSIKQSDFNEKNGSKFSHLLTVRTEGLTPLLYGQPDHKISVFYDFPLQGGMLYGQYTSSDLQLIFEI